MSDTELIKDLFEGVIDDNALAKLSKEELDARNEATIKQVTGLIEMDQVDTYVDYLESKF